MRSPRRSSFSIDNSEVSASNELMTNTVTEEFTLCLNNRRVLKNNLRETISLYTSRVIATEEFI